MKSLVFLSLFFLFFSSNSQSYFPIDTTTGEVVYTDVVRVDSTSAKELYSRAKLFLAEIMNSLPDVIKLDDAENNILIVKAKMKIPGTNSTSLKRYHFGRVSFTIKIEVKDGRYRYRFYDFKQECDVALATDYCCYFGTLRDDTEPPKQIGCKNTFPEFRATVSEKIDNVIFTMTKYMEQPISTSPSSGW